MMLVKIPEILTVQTAQEIKLQKVPKTGLAAILRDWMKARTGTKVQRRFTIKQMCEALCVPSGYDHQKVSNTLQDFERRGELITYTDKRNRRHFLYVQDWQAELKGKLTRKIYKAMYVSHDFAVVDIQRLTGLQDRSWLDKIVRDLTARGHLQVIQQRRRANGLGIERVYHVVNRDKFKLEVMR